MKYSEAYNKIIDAYFKDEIKPFDDRFCFCGTLSPNSEWASFLARESFVYPYTVKEYERMESALFSTFPEVEYLSAATLSYCEEPSDYIEKHSETFEDFLFEGMCAALDVLKQIHIDRGEIIDEELILTKRQLQTV